MARPPAKKGASRKRPASAVRKGQTTSTRKGSAKKAAAAIRRPPEIPVAKWRTYSAGYQKRLAGFYAKHPGAPLYRARGKQAGESLTRRQRLQQRIEAFAVRQAARSGADAGELAERLARAVRSPGGEGWFGRYERRVAENHAAWVEAGRPRSGSPRSLGRSLDAMADELDEDGIDWEWEASDLFYH